MGLLDMVLGRRPRLQESVGQSQPWDEHIPGMSGMGNDAPDPIMALPPMAHSRMPASPDQTMLPTGPEPAPAAAPDRLHTLQAEYDDSNKPLSLGRKILTTALGGIAAGAGGASGERGAGEAATHNIMGTLDQYDRDRASNRRSLQQQITEEQRYQGTLAHQTSQDAETKRLHDAQIGNINDEIANRGNQAPARQEIEGPEGNGVIQQWDPATHSWKEMGKAFHPDKAPQADEIERLWNNDPANAGKKMSLQDRIDYENQLAKGKHQPPEPSYTPLTDSAGNVKGKWNSRTGTAEPITPPKPAADGTAPPPFRKGPMPAAIANRDIQAGAVTQQLETAKSAIEKIKDKIGPGPGRIQKLEDLYGSPDPDVKKAAGEIDSYLALQPGLAGMRSNERVEVLSKKFGDIHLTAEALKAGLEGVGGHAAAVHGAITRYESGGSTMPPPPGAESEVYVKGKLAGHVVKGAYVPLAGGQNAATKK